MSFVGLEPFSEEGEVAGRSLDEGEGFQWLHPGGGGLL